MLNLEPGIDLEEVEASTGVDEEFDGAGVRVARGFGDPHRGGTKILAKAVVDRRPRGFLDQLLMTTLHRTIAFAQPDDVAGTIRKDLHLDVPSVLDRTLQIERRLPERCCRLTGGGAPCRLELLALSYRSHPFAATTTGGLEQDGISDPFGRDPCGGNIGERLGPFRDRDLRFARETAGGSLLAETALHPGRRPDEDQAGIGHRLGEIGVLGKETVARVDGDRAGPPGDLDNPPAVQVALAWRRRADRIGGVGGPNVQRVAVDVAGDGDRADAEIVAGANDAERDLAAIGDEDGGERRSPLLQRDVAVLAPWIRVPLGCERA